MYRVRGQFIAYAFRHNEKRWNMPRAMNCAVDAIHLVPTMFVWLFNEHRIAKTKKSIFFTNRLLIRFFHQVFAHEGTDEQEQG